MSIFKLCEYVNPLNEKIDFSDCVVGYTNFGIVDYDMSFEKSIINFFSNISSVKINERKFTLKIYKTFKSRIELLKYRQNILSVFNINKHYKQSGNCDNKCYPFYENGTLNFNLLGCKFSINAVYSSGLENFNLDNDTEWNEFAFDESIEFIATDPHFYDTYINIIELNTSHFQQNLDPCNFKFNCDCKNDNFTINNFDFCDYKINCDCGDFGFGNSYYNNTINLNKLYGDCEFCLTANGIVFPNFEIIGNFTNLEIRSSSGNFIKIPSDYNSGYIYINFEDYFTNKYVNNIYGDYIVFNSENEKLSVTTSSNSDDFVIKLHYKNRFLGL